MTAALPEPVLGDPTAEAQAQRLLALRDAIAAERAAAVSPAVDRALELADSHLYLALTYLGRADDLVPEE